MAIRFRSGSHLKGVDPDAAALALESVYREKGNRLDAADVVEDAANPASPLHDAFEWDNTEAAHQHRLAQARRLIRAVIIVPDAPQTAPRPVWVNISAGNYQPISAVVEAPALFEIAVTAAQRRVESAMRALRELRAAAGESDDAARLAAIDRAIQSATDVRAALSALARSA